MNKSGSFCERYLFLLLDILVIFSLSACSSSIELPPTPAFEETPTKSLPSGLSPSPTPDTPQSEYFEKVLLLETTNIPLKIGDNIHIIRASEIHDMNEDGIVDAILHISSYPEQIPHPLVILSGCGPVKNIASQIFPDGIPEIGHSNQILFIDIDNDNHEDLLVSEAGIDHPPWYSPDARIGIAMNQDNGIFKDVSSWVPDEAKGLRNYSIAAGDLYNDGIIRIILPSQAITKVGSEYSGPDKSGLLFWNGNEFVFQQNWIDMSLWWGEKLYSSQYMSIQDIDADGWQDLYIAGNWTVPNHRILFGGESFPTSKLLSTLPDGPYGHTPYETFMHPDVDIAYGADVSRALFNDFDRDGDLDIVAVMEETINYKPGIFNDENQPWYSWVSESGGEIYQNIWFQVLRNDGDRKFVDIVDQGRDLGLRLYISLLPVDIDLDGDTDIIGQYWSKQSTAECIQRWGSTIFINDGRLEFTTIDAAEVFPELSSEAEQISLESECATLGLGVLFPTEISTNGINGLFVAPVEDWNSDKPELRVLRFQAIGQFHVPD